MCWDRERDFAQFAILGVVSITCKHLSNEVSNCMDQNKNVKELPVE